MIAMVLCWQRKKLLDDMKFQWPRTPNEVKRDLLPTSRMASAGIEN